MQRQRRRCWLRFLEPAPCKMMRFKLAAMISCRCTMLSRYLGLLRPMRCTQWHLLVSARKLVLSQIRCQTRNRWTTTRFKPLLQCLQMTPTLMFYQEYRSTTLHSLALTMNLVSMPCGQHRRVHICNSHCGHSHLIRSYLSTSTVVNSLFKGTISIRDDGNEPDKRMCAWSI